MRPVNLLPEEHRARRATGKLAGSSYVLVGALAVLLGMLTLYVLTSNQVSARKADAAAAKRDAQRAQTEINQLGPFGSFTQIKQVRVASVTDLAQARFDWERFVRELALVLPRGSWLTEVDAATTGEDQPGGAGSAASGPHANLKGCAPHQPDVAKLMVRLRKMNRVDDVELTESSQKADAAAAAGGSTPSAGAAGTPVTPGKSDDCGKRYQFELVVQFSEELPAISSTGAHKVPVSLGGGE
jgi:Tfp pilus assembly protein PilN